MGRLIRLRVCIYCTFPVDSYVHLVHVSPINRWEHIMRHDLVIPAARLAAVNGSIVLPPAHEQPDVLTSDWLVLQFDRLHDTGEVIGVSESRGGALADAFACDLNEGRIVAIARADTEI